MLHAHSLVAHIYPITVCTKVVKEPSRFNEDSETSEHHMPGVPAQGSRMCYSSPIHTACVCMQIKLTGSAV